MKFLFKITITLIIIFNGPPFSLASNLLNSRDVFNKSYTILDNWLVGCNNLNLCTAIGYPKKGDYGVMQEWYVVIHWQKFHNNANLHFTMSNDLMEEVSDEKTNKLILDLCDNNNNCQNNSINIQLNDEGIFTFDLKDIDITKYITISITYGDYNKKIDLKQAISASNSLQNIFSDDLHNNVVKWKTIEQLHYRDIQKKYKNFKRDETCDSDDFNYEYYITTYKNGDKILFACDNGGYNYALFKIENSSLKKIKFEILTALIFNFGNDESNSILSFYYEKKINKYYIATSNSSGIYACDSLYNFSYDGTTFFVSEYKFMPLCMNIKLSDWMSLYEVTLK